MVTNDLNRFPSAIERSYEAYLVGLVLAMRKLIDARMMRAYRQALAERNSEIHRDSAQPTIAKDAWADWIEVAVSDLDLALRSTIGDAERKTVETGGDIYEFNKGNANRLFASLVGTNFIRSEPWAAEYLRVWSRDNTKLIKTIAPDYLEQVAQRATDYVKSGKNPRLFADELRRQYGLKKFQAKNIARTETAKLNGQLTKTRQQKVGLDEYVWRTSGDERVRRSHARLNGKICSWSDPTVYKDGPEDSWKKRTSIGAYVGDPGDDYQCRCHSAVRVESLVDRLLAEMEQG